MNMRNATCVGTQTSKVPTRVTLLFIPYTVVLANERSHLTFSRVLLTAPSTLAM